MIRRPPRSTLSASSAASDVYKRQVCVCVSGTFVSAWTTLCGCKTRLGAPVKAFGLNLLSAFLQMVSFVLIVGWVWSIIWGMNFVQIASKCS